MSTELTPTAVLFLAKVCEYLAVKNTSKDNVFRGGGINSRLAQTIYMERIGIQNRFNLNPSDPTLIGTSNYLFSLLTNSGQAQIVQNNVAGSLPVITGPANQSGVVGFNASFSVSVAGTGPFVYAWFRNGVLVPGAITNTLSVPNAQLVDSGSTFFVTATNATGTSVSGTATLTVTASLVASYYFGDTDYSTALNSGTDNVAFLGTFPITTGQPLSFTWPLGAANNKFIVVRYPVAESTKTAFANAPLNNGLIPSIAFDNVVTIGSFKYIFSRNGNPFSQNTAAPLIFS